MKKNSFDRFPCCAKCFIPAFIGILLLFQPGCAFSQEESRDFFSDEHLNAPSAGSLTIAVDNLNFFKNNEYKSKYVNGYTLTGSWIRPKLFYYPDKNFRLELGGQVLAYNGREDYKIYPWFSALYQPTKNLSFRMGNLNQDGNHGLPEPLLDSEHFIRDKPEAGIQTKFKNNRWTVDMWIDWQTLIFAGDPYKERFAFGTVAELTLHRSDESSLTLPITFNGLHEGGEIDNAPGLAKTHITISEGLKYRGNLDGSILKSWDLSGLLLQSTYPQGETALPGKRGNAFFLQTSLNSDYGSLASGFWQGNDFFTPLGMPLYQNGAIGQQAEVSSNQLWIFSYRYDRTIFNQSKFGFNFNLYYNPVTQQKSNNESLYLMINLSFLSRKTAK